MTEQTLQDVADQALAQTGSASAAIFLLEPSGALKLAAAAGITGQPLDRLMEAVKSPDHPIARTAQDGETAHDVMPMAPGGPALRSHVAMVGGDAQDRVVGVIALAHQLPLTDDQRRAATELAVQAAELA
jgi:GAF domain-containing protein